MNAPWFAAIFPHNAELFLPPGGEQVWSDIRSVQKWEKWPANEFRPIQRPLGRAIVIGHCFASNDQLSEALDSILATNRPEAFTKLPGSFSVVILERHCLTLIGDISGQFPIYYGISAGKTVISSQPKIVADLSRGPNPDKFQIAASIITNQSLEMVGGRSCFAEVSCLQPATIVQITEEGNIQTHRYEEFEVNSFQKLEETAQELRIILKEAVSSRLRIENSVSSDFSGGMDSSSLAFLAAKSSSKEIPVFTHYIPGFPSGDLPYAQKYAQLSDQLSLNLLPLKYNDFSIASDPWADSLSNSMPFSREVVRYYYRNVHNSGSQIHLVGHGGDEVFSQSLTCMPDLIRDKKFDQFFYSGLAWARQCKQPPLALWWNMLRFAYKNPINELNELVQQIENPYRYERFIKKPGSLSPRFWTLEWSGVTALTSTMRRELAAIIKQEAADKAQIAETIGFGNYLILSRVRTSALIVSRLRWNTANLDICLHAPFLDKDVIRACLTVPSYQRADPHEFKFLLRKALAGVIPEQVISRQSKGNYTAAVYHQLQHELPTFRKLFQNSYLADLGIIEPKQVYNLLDQFGIDPCFPFRTLGQIITSELWIRGLEAQTSIQIFKDKRENINKGSLIVQKGKRDRKPFSVLEDTTKKRYYASPQIRAAASKAGHLALLNMQTNSYHILNPTAANILRALNQTNSAIDSASLILSIYPDINKDLLGKDITHCIREWLTEKIITTKSNHMPTALPSPCAQDFYQTEAGLTIMSRRLENIRLRWQENTLIVIAFSIGLILNRFSIRLRLGLLKRVQQHWCKRKATKNEAHRFLTGAHKVTAYYMGRIACLEASYAAALAAALARYRVEWHLGAAFDPPAFHAWIEAEGQPIRTTMDDPVTGSYQSFFRAQNIKSLALMGDFLPNQDIEVNKPVSNL